MNNFHFYRLFCEIYIKTIVKKSKKLAGLVRTFFHIQVITITYAYITFKVYFPWLHILPNAAYKNMVYKNIWLLGASGYWCENIWFISQISAGLWPSRGEGFFLLWCGGFLISHSSKKQPDPRVCSCSLCFQKVCTSLIWQKAEAWLLNVSVVFTEGE